MKFRIAEEERRKRRRNLLFGLAFTAVLVGLVALEHRRAPEQYNTVLLWSVVGFAVLANLVNYLRHRRWVRLSRDHFLEVLPDRIRFSTNGQLSELQPEQIAAVRFHRRRGRLQHIQILLNSRRGIRLEGYQDLSDLGRRLAERLPAAKLMGRGD